VHIAPERLRGGWNRHPPRALDDLTGVPRVQLLFASEQIRAHRRTPTMPCAGSCWIDSTALAQEINARSDGRRGPPLASQLPNGQLSADSYQLSESELKGTS
jgi:hypothetical protein